MVVGELEGDGQEPTRRVMSKDRAEDLGPPRAAIPSGQQFLSLNGRGGESRDDGLKLFMPSHRWQCWSSVGARRLLDERQNYSLYRADT